MQKLLDNFSAISKEEWIKQIEKELKGKNLDTLNWKIVDGIILKPFYLQEDINHIANADKLKITIAQQRELCEYIDVNNVEIANKRALSALVNGANSLHFNCMNAEINLDFFDQLLKDIHWEFISIHFTINQGEKFLNHLHEWCKKNQIKTSELRGSIYFDVYHRELLSGFTADEEDFKKFIISSYNFFPSLSNVCINATSYLNAGANAIQEISYTTSHVNEYLHLLSEADLLNQVTSVQIQLAIGSNYLLEISKLRALRLLLASVFEKYNLQKEISLHAFTATINKSHKDAYNNMIRATTELMAAIIGGANLITALPYDYLTAETSSFSERIARNIFFILSEESYLDKVIDPAAGSYFFENLTHQLAEKSWEKFCTIENEGGWKVKLLSGEMIKEIENNAEQLIEQYSENKKVLIGVNKYLNQNDKELKVALNSSKAVSEPNTLNELILSSML